MELNDDLRLARRNLATVDGYELLEDFTWDVLYSKWVLKFRMKADAISAFVPESTDWYLTVSPLYPFGEIDIYPAAENGITCTFQHQSYNQLLPEKKWRTGNICVSTSVGLWGKKYFNSEPYIASERLRWHMVRCKDWIVAAATNALFAAGDPFELPMLTKTNGQLFVFNEDEKTFSSWSEQDKNYGTFLAKEALGNRPVFPILNFKAGGKEVRYEWGKQISQKTAVEHTNFWVMLDKIPVLQPWQIPATWGALFSVTKEQGIDLKDILEKNIFKKGKRLYKHLLIGFPIPENVGGAACRIHWLAIMLPAVPPLSGFRQASAALQTAQFSIMFKNDAAISWDITENWHKDEITSRGKISAPIHDLRFTIVGVGAIGAVLAELLLRLGCDNIMLLDGDVVEIGNLSRHTLTMNNVYSNKADSVAERLNSIFPNAEVATIRKKLDYRLGPHTLEKIVLDTDVFIDATGDDALIHFMSELLQGCESRFISISTGFAAKRLFCFMTDTGKHPIKEAFTKAISPWLEKDAAENPDPTFPHEGIGCWHPLFPARINDIWMHVSTVMGRIEHFLQNDTGTEFIVVEKQTNAEGVITGVKIIEDK